MSLEEQACLPCQFGMPRLSEAEAKAKLADIAGWQVTDNGSWLRREFTFKNWKQGFAFLKEIDVIAETAKHHPDIEFGWGYCRVALQTHKIEGLHDNDFILAAKINAAYQPVA